MDWWCWCWCLGRQLRSRFFLKKRRSWASSEVGSKSLVGLLNYIRRNHRWVGTWRAKWRSRRIGAAVQRSWSGSQNGLASCNTSCSTTYEPNNTKPNRTKKARVINDHFLSMDTHNHKISWSQVVLVYISLEQVNKHCMFQNVNWVTSKKKKKKREKNDNCQNGPEWY
jgi:hypothetical protein